MPPHEFGLSSSELDERESEIESVNEKIEQWATDPRALDEELASAGYHATYILTKALTEGASEIDAIDTRISTYEHRRYSVLREIDRHNESTARRLDKAAFEIIDGEFTEAAE
jgi:hypothetical protein